MKKLTRCIEILSTRKISETLPTADFEFEAKVEMTDSTGENILREGMLYPEDIFLERFPDQKKRKTMSLQRETLNDKPYIRVLDGIAGVLRFSNYTDTKTEHSRRVDDQLRLSKNQAKNTYDTLVGSQFGGTSSAKLWSRAILARRRPRKARRNSKNTAAMSLPVVFPQRQFH